VLARCPSCLNTFSTGQPGRQSCPVCNRSLVVPEISGQAAAPGAGQSEAPPGTPWERRHELGFWTGWGRTVQQALFEPSALFASARLDRGAAQLGFALLTTSIFWIIGELLEAPLRHMIAVRFRDSLAQISSDPDLQRTIDEWLQRTSPAGLVASVLLTPVVTLVFLYVNAALTHAVAAVMGQAKRGFPATFAACAYACAPLVFLAVPGCGSIIGVLWTVVLASIGIKITHRISSGAAAVAVLAPYLVLCCVTFLAAGSFAMAWRRVVQP
jgi:hypothetical protein